MRYLDEWTDEILARIQATDQRFDGADQSFPDFRLSPTEVTAVLTAQGQSSANVLRFQLLAVYFNLATRRINAGTTLSSKTSAGLGLANVRDAALYAIGTLALPVSENTARYNDAIRALDELNTDRSEVY